MNELLGISPSLFSELCYIYSHFNDNGDSERLGGEADTHVGSVLPPHNSGGRDQGSTSHSSPPGEASSMPSSPSESATEDNLGQNGSSRRLPSQRQTSHETKINILEEEFLDAMFNDDLFEGFPITLTELYVAILSMQSIPRRVFAETA